MSSNLTKLIPLGQFTRMNDEAFYFATMCDAVTQAFDVETFLNLYDYYIEQTNSLKKPSKHVSKWFDPQAPWYVTYQVTEWKPLSIFDDEFQNVVPCEPPVLDLTSDAKFIDYLRDFKPALYDPLDYVLELVDDEKFIDKLIDYEPPQADLTTEGVEPNPGPQYTPILEREQSKFFNGFFNPIFPVVPNPLQPNLAQILQFNIPANIGVVGRVIYTFSFYFAAYVARFLLYCNYPRNAILPATQIVCITLSVWLLTISSYVLSKGLIALLLLIAGIEPNPGPQSGDALPRESSETLPVDSLDFTVKCKQSRSQEKRNSKFSKAYINSLLETQEREKRLTRLRRSQRQHKLTKWDCEVPSSIVVPHNSRRLAKFLETKKELPSANGLIKKLMVRCCAKKEDPIYKFLTTRCNFDEITAMALSPIIRALKDILTNKITIGIALCILAYFLAKYVDLPIFIFTPVVALILNYLITNLSQRVIEAVTGLYEVFLKHFEQLKVSVAKLGTVTITHKDFKKVDLDIVSAAVIYYSRTGPEITWKKDTIDFMRHHQYPILERSFSIDVPTELATFLKKLETGTEDDLEQHIQANGFTEIVQNFRKHFEDLLKGVGLVSETFTLPQSVYFYQSTKKFVKQIYDIFTDLYPPIYEFITGKIYVSPEVAKYLKIFGDIAQKVHLTLKEARQSNILKENTQFRLRIVLEYEALLDAQMKLLQMKAPPTYMTPLNTLIREMSTLANQCYSRTRGEAQRDEPVLIFVRGPPGVGKTTIDHALALIIAERLGFQIDVRTDFFQREAGVEHWDGYENQTFVVLDDAFQLTDPVKQAATILEVIKCKNTAPYKLTMAALEDKKNSFFNSKFVFISTNVENVVCDQVADIGAFFRRIDFDVVVKKRPPVNADGSLSFDYEMIVNGKRTTIPVLADSIVAVHQSRSLSDKNVAQRIVRYAKDVPACAVSDLIAPRDNVRDFHGHMHDSYQTRSNGLVERLTMLGSTVLTKTGEFAYNCWSHKTPAIQSLEHVGKHITTLLEFSRNYSFWLATFAISSSAAFLVTKHLKNLALTMFPNSRKVKDQLTGDKATQVATANDTLKSHLKAAQAAIDKIAVKQVKANGSSKRWSHAMISYISELGWNNQQWVADSLASIVPIEEFETTPQEKSDLDRLRSNIVEIYTYYESKGERFKMFGKALILNQNHLLTSSHQIPEAATVVNLEINILGKVVNITNCKIERIPNADTCVIALSTVLPHRDIAYMFGPLSEVTSTESEIYFLRNFDEVLTICPVNDFEPTDRQVTYQTDYNEVVVCGNVFNCKVAVCPGDSGGIYVARENGRFKIIGMHVASSFHSAHARFLFREMLMKYIKPPRKASTPYDTLKEVVTGASRSFDESIVCNSNCIFIGYVAPRTMIASRSKISRSILYRHKLMPSLTEFPAVLKRTYDENDPLLKANSKFRLRTEPQIENVLKNEIIHALLDEHPNTPVNSFYTNLQAIEGTTDMPRLNMKTSSGYPDSAIGKTPKSQLEPSDWARICSETDDLLEDLYNGISPFAIYQTSFKDETRKFPKILLPRVVNCAPVKLTLLFRRVLGPWMNMVHKNHTKIRTKVGINVHGDDWRVLYDRLCRISHENLVELDYSGYEYNHPQFGYIYAGDFIYMLYKRSGFSEKDCQAARLLILSCSGGYVLQNEILIYVWMLLSGLPITAELNSLLNEIYQMLAFRKLTGKSVVVMREFVESAFYGDDLLHSVHNDISQQFNALTIKDFCQEFLSMTVTPASDKSGQMNKFISILESSFLCRKFAPRSNRVDAPINLEVATNSLQFYIPVAHMTQRELLSAKCRSMLTELTHYPPEIYDHWAAILMQIKAEFKLDFICYDYSTALCRRVTMIDI